MPIKILATADLHLGRKSSAVPSVADESSTKHTWNNMVDRAIEQGVHVLLLSGDIIDQDNKYYEAIGPIQSGFDKLNKNGIAVYLVTGNHDFDVLAEIIRSNKYENIHLLGAGGNWEKKTYKSDEGMLQVAGWSFPNKYVTENPMIKFSELELDPNVVTVGLLHGEVDALESKYAPVSLSELKFAGPEAWILGHIHKPVEFSSEAPYIAYPGSPHALDPGETGAHGPVLLEVYGKNDIKVERIPLSPIRYENITVAVETGDDESAVRDAMTSTLLQEGQKLLPELANVAFLVYDIVLEGTHTEVKELDDWIDPVVQNYEQKLETGTQITVRKVENNVQPAVENLEELAENPSPAGKLAETILAIQQGRTTPFLNKLTDEWKGKIQKLNKAGTYSPLKQDGRLPEFDEQMARKAILQECNQLLNKLINQQQT